LRTTVRHERSSPATTTISHAANASQKKTSETVVSEA